MRARYKPPSRERFLFDLDMLLLQVWGKRALPDDVAERIFDRAERELIFVAGCRRQRRLGRVFGLGATAE